MRLVSALGLLAGGFLFVPKGLIALSVIWGVAKFSPVLGVGLFAFSLLIGGLR